MKVAFSADLIARGKRREFIVKLNSWNLLLNTLGLNGLLSLPLFSY